MLLGLLALAGCFSSGCKEVTPVDPASYFPLKIGSVEFTAQFAIDPDTQRKGLMYREELGEDQGMLFVSQRPRRQSFWMRNTLIPLDIGFFTEDGILREVYPMFPRDEKHVVSRRNDLLYALEMNRGWFKAKGIRIGDQLDLELVRKADRTIRSQGY